jgi:hypothetical protein
MKFFLSVLIVLFSFLFLDSCLIFDDDATNIKNDFYAKKGGWDWIRVPLIDPYQVLKANPNSEGSEWSINLDYSITKLSNARNVESVFVSDSIIMVLCGNDDEGTNLNNEKCHVAYYIYDLKRNRFLGFSEQHKFTEYVKGQKYSEPKWMNIDTLHKIFASGETLPWFN